MSKTEEIKAYRVKEFCTAMGISATTFWKFVKTGKIRVIHIGGRALVPHAEATRLLSEGAR
jgi:predicted site-specific integrase-resolvase